MPSSSVIITGAAGALGGKIALKLAELDPKQYHLVLAARNTTNENANELSAQLLTAGVTFTWEKLDLSSLEAVNNFADRIHTAVAEKQIPHLYGLVNCAAIQMMPITKTVDGFDLEYQTNTLAPILLMQKLAPLFVKGVVINVSSSTHGMGSYAQFREEHSKLEESVGQVLSTPALLKKYGSTKLILLVAGYALQRDANFSSTQIVAADPGGMSGSSRLAPEGRWLLKFAQLLFIALRPILRIFFPSAINPPGVPAEAIVNLIRQAPEKDLERFYVLEKPSESAPTSQDESKQEEALALVMEDLKKWL